ncbi:hypothetical protein D3C78_1708500 [compost metagenome]
MRTQHPTFAAIVGTEGQAAQFFALLMWEAMAIITSFVRGEPKVLRGSLARVATIWSLCDKVAVFIAGPCCYEPAISNLANLLIFLLLTPLSGETVFLFGVKLF